MTTVVAMIADNQNENRQPERK